MDAIRLRPGTGSFLCEFFLQNLLHFRNFVVKYYYKQTVVVVNGGDKLKGCENIDMFAAGKRLRDLRGIRSRRGTVKSMREEGLNISYSSLSFYESGIRTPKPDTRQKLADYYGVPVDLIFDA